MGHKNQIRQHLSTLKHVWKRGDDGFLLPVVIALGVAISTVSVLALQGVAQNSVTTNNNYYDTLAHEAAIAGKAMATSCIAKNQLPVRNALQPLQVNTDCNGLVNLSKPNYVAKSDNYISYFKVAPYENPTTNTIVITSRGYIDFLKPNGTVAKSQAFTDSIRTLKRSSPATGNISKDVDDLSMGYNHTCAAAEGQAYCWGWNANGQLGKWNSNSDSNLPVEVDVNTVPTPYIPCTNGLACGIPALNNSKPAHPVSPLVGKYVTKVAAGNDHSCALTSEGKVYCWGHNNYGQLGDRTNNDSQVPVPVDTLGIETPAFLGDPIGCNPALPYGILNGCRTDPRPVIQKSALAGKKVIDIQAGDSYTCALTEDNAVACWGDNGLGQLGDGTRTHRNYPVAPYASDAKPEVVRQPAGCSPRGTGGILGFFNQCVIDPVPAKPATPLFNKKVSKLGKMSNNKHTCVITEDNIPVCWGRNFGGQVGNDVSHDTDPGGCGAYPEITSDNDALEPQVVYQGGETATTQYYLWGLWSTSSTRPASALQGKTITAIAESSSYTTALGSDGSLYWWGGNTYTSTTCKHVCTKNSNGTQQCRSDGNRYRHYNINSRPLGPMYSSPKTCYFALWNFPCGDVSNVQGKQFIRFSGNSNDDVFCGQTGLDIYCQMPTAQSFTAYVARQCDYLGGYWGQLGTGDGPGLPSLRSNPCWTTNPTAVKMDGWLKGKTITDMQTAYATTPAIPFDSRTTAYTCVLASKQVGCWGANYQGQLGTGDNTARNEATAVNVDSPLGKPGGGGGNYSDNTDF